MCFDRALRAPRRERDRDRDRQSQRDRDRETETGRQTDRDRQTARDRETESKTDRGYSPVAEKKTAHTSANQNVNPQYQKYTSSSVYFSLLLLSP